jgi:intermediate cleaving peptidase 55
MLKPGELTPGITALEYFQRRITLAEEIPSRSVAIVVGSSVQFASGSVFYDFQQNNDLFYLSGWNEPDSVIMIEKPNENLDDVIFHMVVPPKERHSEQWDGARTGLEGAKEIFNADEVSDTYRLGSYLDKVIARNDNVFIDLPEKTIKKASTQTSFNNFFSIGGNSKYSTIHDVLDANGTGKNIKPLRHLIANRRAIKSPDELKVMRRIGQISGIAYNHAYAKRFRTERTLKAFLEYKFISGGADKSAYIPVVAGGDNALCIHYTRNDDILYDDELILVDAAGSLGGYCADISRTWPVSGKFSEPQKELYQAVLNVQKACIEQCTVESGISLQDLHDLSMDYYKKELKNVTGFGSLSTFDVSKIYPHYIGHNLGLDVHDTPGFSRFDKLKQGQVITVEPGIYIPDDNSYPAAFRGIGIRIEDDIYVGKDTYINLTVEAAKEIVDIEHIAEHGVTTPHEEEVVEVF